jgi:ATP-dependent DNA helicase RecQ
MYLSEQTGWDHVRAAFQRIWGYSDFRSPQGEIIHSLLTHRDSLVVMPTGGGKSICFQLPALMRTGLTLVVSPLVALMENQVKELHDRHLPAALLHGELPSYQRRQTLIDIQRQHLRLLYLSPETLLSPPVWEVLCHPNLKINGLVLDEAHCLVQWGDTFRPAYRRLGAVRPALLQYKPPGTQIAIAAFTATADPQAQESIREALQLKQPQIYRLNPYRANLNLAVQTAWTPRGRRQRLLRFIQQHAKQSGLVYVRTRRDSESLAMWLSQKNHKTAAYHAGLSPDERRYIETAWLQGDIQFVVCTSAFGMGINKPDVRWVTHFHAPVLLSEYVQEVGRAGRDGKPAEALTLVSEPTGWLDSEDKQRLGFFQNRVRSQQRIAQDLVQQLPIHGEVDAIARQFKHGVIALSLLHRSGQLQWKDPFHYVLHSTEAPQFPQQQRGVEQMLQFLTTSECRWKFLLQAFGFDEDAEEMHCGHCDRCLVRR